MGSHPGLRLLVQIQTRGGGRPEPTFLFNILPKRLEDSSYNSTQSSSVPAKILDVMARRDDLRKRYPTSYELLKLNKDIQKHICVHKMERDFVETMDQNTNLTKLWGIIEEACTSRSLQDYKNKSSFL